MSDSTELEALRGIYAVWKDVAPEVSADLSRKVRAAFATKDAEIARLQAELAAATEWANAFSGGAEKIRDMSGETVRLRADLAALREAVRAMPMVHSRECMEMGERTTRRCSCNTDAANAALAAARKLAG